MIIEQPPRLLRWLFPHALWRMDQSQRSVYLTFDDGPIPEATPYILDVLDSLDIKATFFMVGDNAQRYPYLLEEVLTTILEVSDGSRGSTWEMYRRPRIFCKLENCSVLHAVG